MRGCACRTCTNERIYDRARPGRPEKDRAWRAGLSEAAHARQMALKRKRERAQADRRDAERMQLLRRAA